jgi:hypothetical protein
MDPVNRRSVWRHLDDVKNDRVILITTHAMEEADLLADMVGIMKKGEMVALGSPLALKAEHGTALQFNILVGKDDVHQSVPQIRHHFESDRQWINVKFSEAGDITVTIKKVKEKSTGVGVEVERLTSFVKWLESEESKVAEYGFSNSSLEEVFLKVTDNDVQADENTRNEDDLEAVVVVDGPDDAHSGNIGVTSYIPRMALLPQLKALVFHWLRLNWTKRRSLWSWGVYGLMVLCSTLYGCRVANSREDFLFILPILFLTTIIIHVTSTVYWDRQEGLLYYMRSQGMFLWSYIVGIGVYSFLVYFVYTFVLLSLFYATPLFWAPEICPSGEYCTRGLLNRPILNMYDVTQVPFDTGSPDVQLYAYTVPSGYGKIFGIIFCFALTGPAGVLAASYIPGHKFALVLIGCTVLITAATPLIVYSAKVISNYGAVLTCGEELDPENACGNVFNSTNVTSAFLNCVGIETTGTNIWEFCIPSYAAMLPQLGLYLSLGMMMKSEIVFFSEPASYLNEVFIPSLRRLDCAGDTCSFPLAASRYPVILSFMIVGAICLLFIGLILSQLHEKLSVWAVNFMEVFSLRWKKSTSETSTGHAEQAGELDEVKEERKIVKDLMSPYLVAPDEEIIGEADQLGKNFIRVKDHTTLPRDELPPIVVHGLHKIYPGLGGLPPKLALKSLDLQVPEGQVLGLLGKNGAGMFVLSYCCHPPTIMIVPHFVSSY